MANQTFSFTRKYFSVPIVTPLLVGLLTVWIIYLIEFFKGDSNYDNANNLVDLVSILQFVGTMSFPLVAVAIAFPTGRTSSTLTFSSQGISEVKRYLFGLIPIRRSYTWADFTGWFKNIIKDPDNNVLVIACFGLFTKSKRALWILRPEVQHIRIDNGPSIKLNNSDDGYAAWIKATEGLAQTLKNALPENYPEWVRKRQDAAMSWIIGFFITAIVVMLLVYFSPVLVIIIATLGTIFR
jgi:hypothetical protein